MATTHRKFYLGMGIVIFLLLLVVIAAWKKTLGIIINVSDTPLLTTESYIIPIAEEDKIFGNPGSPLTLVEFVDLGGRSSLDLHKILYSFVKTNPKLVRLVWKDSPQTHIFGGSSEQLHKTAFCAGEQNKFWDFVNAVEAKQINDSANLTQNTANILKIDSKKLAACLLDVKTSAALIAANNLNNELGLSNAPALYANNKKVDLTQGADIPELLKQILPTP